MIKCSQKYLNENDLIGQVNHYLDDFVWPPSLINEALSIITEQKQNELKQKLFGYNQTKNQIHQLDEKIKGLIDLRLQGIINDEELLQKKNELTAKKLSLKAKNGQNWGQTRSSFEPVEIVFKNLSVAKKIRVDDTNLAKKPNSCP